MNKETIGNMTLGLFALQVMVGSVITFIAIVGIVGLIHTYQIIEKGEYPSIKKICLGFIDSIKESLKKIKEKVKNV